MRFLSLHACTCAYVCLWCISSECVCGAHVDMVDKCVWEKKLRCTLLYVSAAWHMCSVKTTVAFCHGWNTFIFWVWGPAGSNEHLWSFLSLSASSPQEAKDCRHTLPPLAYKSLSDPISGFHLSRPRYALHSTAITSALIRFSGHTICNSIVCSVWQQPYMN